MIEELWGGAPGGRHALDEDAVQTPIFHALKQGGGRRRQQDRAVESLEEFRRDPLTAPIPIQLVASTRDVPTREVLGRPSRDAGRAAARAPREAPGRAVARAAHEVAARSGAAQGRAQGRARERGGSGRTRRGSGRGSGPRHWPGGAATTGSRSPPTGESRVRAR